MQGRMNNVATLEEKVKYLEKFMRKGYLWYCVDSDGAEVVFNANPDRGESTWDTTEGDYRVVEEEYQCGYVDWLHDPVYIGEVIAYLKRQLLPDNEIALLGYRDKYKYIKWAISSGYSYYAIDDNGTEKLFKHKPTQVGDKWVDNKGKGLYIPSDWDFNIEMSNNKMVCIELAESYLKVRAEREEREERESRQELNASVNQDVVNAPKHYTDGGIETIKYIEAKLTPEEYKGFLKGNILKYVSRAGKKDNELQDIKKASAYVRMLICKLESLDEEVKQKAVGICTE